MPMFHLPRESILSVSKILVDCQNVTRFDFQLLDPADTVLSIPPQLIFEVPMEPANDSFQYVAPKNAIMSFSLFS